MENSTTWQVMNTPILYNLCMEAIKEYSPYMIKQGLLCKKLGEYKIIKNPLTFQIYQDGFLIALIYSDGNELIQACNDEDEIIIGLTALLKDIKSV